MSPSIPARRPEERQRPGALEAEQDDRRRGLKPGWIAPSHWRDHPQERAGGAVLVIMLMLGAME